MRPSVLVVDDDPPVLELFGRILEKGGFTPCLVGSGQDAMEVLRHTPVDVLILDLSMPAPDGFELLKVLRATMPTLRIVVVSGFLQGALLEAAGLLGAAATIAKNDAPQRLLETVKAILEQFPPGSPPEKPI